MPTHLCMYICLYVHTIISLSLNMCFCGQLPCWTTWASVFIYCQIPTSAVALSVYKFLEAFAKLEKCLNGGQEGSAAARGQLAIHDIRSKLDKFIKALGPSELQVRVFTIDCFLNVATHAHLWLTTPWNNLWTSHVKHNNNILYNIRLKRSILFFNYSL